MKKIPLIIIFTIIAISIQAQKTDFSWLIGTWKITTSKATIVEAWKQLNDSTLSGKSYRITSPKDTIVQEYLELVFRKGAWSYRPTAIGQNNNQQVIFPMIFTRGTEFICENPQHDFPQRIAYRKVGNHLFASIEGRMKGKFSKQNFDFTKAD